MLLVSGKPVMLWALKRGWGRGGKARKFWWCRAASTRQKFSLFRRFIHSIFIRVVIILDAIVMIGVDEFPRVSRSVDKCSCLVLSSASTRSAQ